LAFAFAPDTLSRFVTSDILPSQPPARRASALALLLAPALLLTGCKQEEITVYRVPKVMPGAGAAPRGEASAGARPHVHWDKLPAGWREEASAGSRAATFSIAGADGKRAEVAAIGFPGMGGTDLQFVNLWREQLGLEPLTNEQLPQLVQPATIAGTEGKVFDLTGSPKPGAEQPADRIIVALHKAEGVSWFVKLTGDPALVEQQKPAFLGFLKGLSFHMEAHGAADAPAPTASTAPAGGGSGAPNWTAPAHWKQQAPGAMQAAKYRIGEGKASAEITAVFLGGMGGALKANLDRWRNQLSLPAAADSEVEKQAPPFPALGSGARIVELSGSTGEGDAADMIVLLVPEGRGTWFYKLMGDKAVVAKEKDALIAFVKSAKN
jgi:hypothetical protein